MVQVPSISNDGADVKARTGFPRVIIAALVSVGLVLPGSYDARAEGSQADFDMSDAVISRSEFVSLAQKVADLTQQEAESAWGNPQAMAEIPVFMSSELVPTFQGSAAEDGVFHPDGYIPNVVSHRAIVYNAFCQGLASVDVRVNFEYNGTRVRIGDYFKTPWAGALAYFDSWGTIKRTYIAGQTALTQPTVRRSPVFSGPTQAAS